MRLTSVFFVIFLIFTTGARAVTWADGQTAGQTDSLGSMITYDLHDAPYSSSGPHLPVASAGIPRH